MLLLIGIVIGLVLGLTGAGGSIFAVPLLLLTGLSLAEATGISLGAVAATTLFASTRLALRGKNLLWMPGIILAVAGAITAPLGQWLAVILPKNVVLIGFCLLALVIALRMWMSANRSPDNANWVRASDFVQIPTPDLLCNLSPSGQFELRPRCVSGLILGGLGVGLLSGLFGVGGGFLIVPLLLALSAISMAQAVGTSLFIIALISSSGFVSHLLIHQPANLSALLWVIGGGVLGMMLGQAISRRIANAQLQKSFAICLLAVCAITLARQYL
jgi:uncharacterized membrane protein YfcA